MHKDKEVLMVVFKPDSTSTKEYMCIIGDEAEFKKWKGGDKTIPLVQVVDAFQLFVSETGSQGQWNRPSAGEIASDFANFNPDGSVREGVYDHTKLPEFPEEEASEGKKGRKAKQVAEEDAIRIVLERGREQHSKNPATGGSAMNPARGGGQSTGHIGGGR